MFEGFRPFDKLRVTITHPVSKAATPLDRVEKHPPAKAGPLFLEGNKNILKDEMNDKLFKKYHEKTQISP